MNAERTAKPWPSGVWDAPLLRGVDPRGKRELEAAGVLRDLRAGERLFVPGDPADAVHVVVSGAVTLSGVRRGETASTVIRRATKGDVFGEEATVALFSTRQLEARCETDAVVAALPLVVLKRAIGRAGGAEHMAKTERVLRRAATLDLLRTTSFTRGLSDGELEMLLDAARHVHLERGTHVYREGDPAADAFFVADGLVQVLTDDDGRPRLEAYLARGDLFGDEELAERAPRSVSVVASGPVWLVAVPRGVFVDIARRHPGRLADARRLRSEAAAAEKQRSGGMQTTAHVLKDLYRMRVARSLLVIHQDACIRCGHCAWSCASVHDDGVSRLVRRGDKMVVQTGDQASVMAPLLVPNSCQHCKNPSCMIDCPTGAIGRDARGEVFIREDLCTGCGSCAKACPWDNIQMAPRADGAAYPAVAVKCDLCKGEGGGPACVASCPTQAIARIDPNAVLAELGSAGEPRTTEPLLPPRIAAWPWVMGSLFAGLGLARFALGLWPTGALAGVLLTLLAAYSIGKRMKPVFGAARGRVPLARWLYVGHLSLGALTLGAVGAHAGVHAPPNVTGALVVVFVLAVASGALGALLGALVPSALTRVERGSVLPEELAGLPREVDAKIFSALSGKSELVKTLFVHSLRPYLASRLGPWLLVGSRRTLRDEERAVRARLDRLTGGKTGSALAGLDELIRLVVEHRAVRAQRLLTWALRAWLVPHVAMAAAAVLLLVLHVYAVVGR